MLAFCRLQIAQLGQSGCCLHGVCFGKHVYRGVALIFEGGETAVEPDVDVLMCGLFSLKLTRHIRETGEQLLF